MGLKSLLGWFSVDMGIDLGTASVLVKGSRGMAMERVARAIREREA